MNRKTFEIQKSYSVLISIRHFYTKQIPLFRTRRLSFFYFNQCISISICCEAEITLSLYDQIVAVRRPDGYSDFTESSWALSEMKHTENHQIWRTELSSILYIKTRRSSADVARVKAGCPQYRHSVKQCHWRNILQSTSLALGYHSCFIYGNDFLAV